MNALALASRADAASLSQFTDSDLDRLRQDRDECQQEDEADGHVTGTAWARKNARYRSLRRVAVVTIDEADDRDAASRMLAAATLGDGNPNWREVSEEMENLFSHENSSLHEVIGFIKGAVDVYEQL